MRYHRSLAVLFLLAALAVVSPAHASRSGRKNTALGISGLALYELARGNTGAGLLAGAGAAYAWNQYNQSHRWHSRHHAFNWGYQEGVRRAYRNRYGPGFGRYRSSR